MKNKRILIIGGTGALGKTLISTYNDFSDIMVFSRDEHKQVNLQKQYPNLTYQIGDVKDKEMDCTTIVMTPKSIKQSSVKEFVGSENKRLILTPLGNEITIYMNKNFPKIMDYNYTSNI